MNPEETDKKIEAAMADVKPSRLDTFTLKTKRLKFRLHDEEFEEIREIAEGLGLSISEYFCALHRHAVKQLSPEGDSQQWVHPEPRDRAHRKRRRG